MKYSSFNPPLECMMKGSTCYRNTSKMEVKGVLLHSTGANNPYIKRYVQPSKNDVNYNKLMQTIGENTLNNDWNSIEIQAGVNAWIGKLANGAIASVQTMPWDYKPWGCGSGPNGSCNNGWIQFEICEDMLSDKLYFDKVYKEACELTAYLCKLYNLNPKGKVNYLGKQVPVILCHQDSYQLGLGSNHADVYHWFNKYNKTMENVRNDVAALLGQKIESVQIIPELTRILRFKSEGDDVLSMQQRLIELGYNLGPYGADGDFGEDTEAAVMKFQQDNNLYIDGEVGPNTWDALFGKAKQDDSRPQTFRIRKSWDQPNTQIGAFRTIENAKKIWREGYYIFNEQGQVVYPIPEKPKKVYRDVMIGSASKDENGRYANGIPGDQTGKEVWILNWYDQSWTSILRPTDAALAEKIASICEDACENNNIGYSQSSRNTLLTQAKLVNYDLSKVAPCNCDCSSFVSTCCVCAGLRESLFFPGGNGCTTWTIADACLQSGKFIQLSDMKYRNQKNYLKRGDILLNRDQHVVIVLSDGMYA